MSSDGLTIWFIASYNLDDGYLCRGMFTVRLDAATRSTGELVNEQYAFGGDKPPATGLHPWIGRLDYLP